MTPQFSFAKQLHKYPLTFIVISKFTPSQSEKYQRKNDKRHRKYFAFAWCEWALITAHKRSCGKVMFSEVLSFHGGDPSLAGGAILTWGGSAILSRGDSVRGGAVKEPHVGQQADGTHPTGMHSCFICMRQRKHFIQKRALFSKCVFGLQTTINRNHWPKLSQQRCKLFTVHLASVFTFT